MFSLRKQRQEALRDMTIKFGLPFQTWPEKLCLFCAKYMHYLNVLTDTWRISASWLLESTCLISRCKCIQSFSSSHQILRTLPLENRIEISNICPLWVFLRSGLAVPKPVARKPLPQKVSAVDTGIWNRRPSPSLMNHHLSHSISDSFAVRKLLILKKDLTKEGVAFDKHMMW